LQEKQFGGNEIELGNKMNMIHYDWAV